VDEASTNKGSHIEGELLYRNAIKGLGLKKIIFKIYIDTNLFEHQKI